MEREFSKSGRKRRCMDRWKKNQGNKIGSKPVTGYIDEVVSVLLCKYLFIEYDNYI